MQLTDMDSSPTESFNWLWFYLISRKDRYS